MLAGADGAPALLRALLAGAALVWWLAAALVAATLVSMADRALALWRLPQP